MTVRQQQCMLMYLGYDPGPIDGIFGKLTGDAIETFQRDNGLAHDRKWGPLTEEKVRYNFNHDIFREDEAIDILPDVPAQNDPAPESGGDFWATIRYFRREEFRCPCGKWCSGFPVEPKEKLVRFLDQMREDFGLEIIVVPPDGHSGGSGVRCGPYNATLKGSAANSTHKEGRAADFSMRNGNANAISKYLASAQAAGKIAYWYQITPDSFHVNI